MFKFGRLEHLEPAYTEGKLRIAPASFYSDPSLNYAVRDDELHFSCIIPPRGAELRVIDEKTRQPISAAIPVVGNMRFTTKCPTDYLVYCLTMGLDLRMFDDFAADACLIITNPGEFLRRIMNAGKARLPGGFGEAHEVDYLDPIRTRLSEVRCFFAKHFRYSYQREFRVMWGPEAPRFDLKPEFLELGSLEDVAEMITLPTS